MNNKFAVGGLGVFGSAIAVIERGADVMAIDESEERIQLISQDVAYAVKRRHEFRRTKSQNLKSVDAAVLALVRASKMLCVFQLQELGVKIIARARGPIQRKILEKCATRY